MANKQTTITVGVQFEAAANSYANIVKELQGAFKSINLDSTVGKQLNRIINSMGEKLQQARTIISGGVGSEITNKEMTKFLSLLESMNTMANRFQYTMNNINVDSLNLDAGEIARLKQARNEVSKLATQIENLQNNSATIGQLFKGDTKPAQTLKATNAGIKDSFTLSQALDAAKQKYTDLGKSVQLTPIISVQVATPACPKLKTSAPYSDPIISPAFQAFRMDPLVWSRSFQLRYK